MTLDEARAYLRSRPMDLKAKEVLELLERMEGALYNLGFHATWKDTWGDNSAISVPLGELRAARDLVRPFTHSRLE
jgi:hypothetical protein